MAGQTGTMTGPERSAAGRRRRPPRQRGRPAARARPSNGATVLTAGEAQVVQER